MTTSGFLMTKSARNSVFRIWCFNLIFTRELVYRYRGVTNLFPYAICQPCCRLFGVGFQEFTLVIARGVARLVMKYLGLVFEYSWRSSIGSRLPYAIDQPGDALFPYDIAQPWLRFSDSTSLLWRFLLYIPVIKFKRVSSSFVCNGLSSDNENPEEPKT